MATDFDLTDKVAIVTGGNGGIGYGIARGLAQAGAHIVVAARDPAKNAQAVATLQELGIHALSVSTDVQTRSLGAGDGTRSRRDIGPRGYSGQ